MDCFYRLSEMDQIRKWLRKDEKSTFVTVADMYGPKVIVICTMDIKYICQYELLEEKETVYTTRYIQFLKNVWSK